ncbi:MAG TPA: Do family serine endopeptidase [Bryobacteraceae bacterium]|nr:Do family serine endopeptidase [Bryobacteraceae bacterium]
MTLLKIVQRQKLLSLGLLMLTLAIGIMIGTLVNTGVHAARTQSAAPDATPLHVPDRVVLGNEFTKLAKSVDPSVVNITADYTPKASASNPHKKGQGGEDQDDDGMDLFRRFFHGDGESPSPSFRRQQSGSGFIVDKNGYILTNNHVVEKVDRIRVKLHGDDTEYKAHLIGFDVETDLAVIKIDPRSSLTPVVIGNSDEMQVGDWAVAIGSPFGLEASVTAGIISATGRDIGARQFQRFIQTDAAINPGNSGGPLLNIRGEVIGVNTMIATQTGGYQGIGFALPINMAVRVYNDIIRSGRVTRGSIGIVLANGEKPELLKALGAKNGVLVQSVEKGGPADKAGIKDDDIITAINGKAVKDGDDLVNQVASSPIGSVSTMTVDRDGKKMDFRVTIGDRAEVFKNNPRFADQQDETEEPSPDTTTQARFGIKIRTLTDADRESMGLPQGRQGVLVTSVDPESFAEDIDIHDKDVIIAINRQPVNSVDDVRRIQSKLQPGDAVAFRIMRMQSLDQKRAPQWLTLYASGTLPR